MDERMFGKERQTHNPSLEMLANMLSDKLTASKLINICEILEKYHPSLRLSH